MRIGEPGEPFVVHEYELHLHEIFERANEELRRITISNLSTNENIESARFFLRDQFEIYYHSNNLDANNTIVIEPKDKGAYETFLAISLAFYDPFKIELFLNYQRDNYKHENFIGLIEYRVYRQIKSWFHFDNSDRYERIMKWVVESKKVSHSRRIKKPKKIISKKMNPLSWIGDEQLLKRLSKQLKKKPNNCVKKVGDFHDVFFSQHQVIWYGSPEYLAYLFYKITIEPYKWVGSKGKPPFTKSVQFFFSFCDNRGKKFNRNDLSKVLNNVIVRGHKKYSKLRSDIDSMLGLILKYTPKD